MAFFLLAVLTILFLLGLYTVLYSPNYFQQFLLLEQEDSSILCGSASFSTPQLSSPSSDVFNDNKNGNNNNSKTNKNKHKHKHKHKHKNTTTTNDDNSNSNSNSNNNTTKVCTMYLAPSLVSDSHNRPTGFGIYTIQSQKQGAKLFPRGVGPLIPITNAINWHNSYQSSWANLLFMPPVWDLALNQTILGHILFLPCVLVQPWESHQLSSSVIEYPTLGYGSVQR